MPRPRRFRGRRDPGAGWRFERSISSMSLSDLDEMRDLADQSPRRRGVGHDRRTADAAETEPTETLALSARSADLASYLSHFDRLRGHGVPQRISSSVLPRSAATRSGS